MFTDLFFRLRSLFRRKAVEAKSTRNSART
jgi:hypothetical protein